jgi:Holliday junction resolvasome RuvABC endonuclease subunit
MSVHACPCGREYGTEDLLALHLRYCAQATEAHLSQLERPVLRNADAERVVHAGLAYAGGTLKLIGIDPGMANFGVSVAELPNLGSGRPRFTFVSVWRTAPSTELGRLRKLDDTAERCSSLALQLHDLVQEHRPVALCVEAIALPYGRIQSSVISALGRVRGIIDALSQVHQVAVLEETSQRLKKLATGAKGATKQQVAEALEREYPELRQLWPPQKTLLEHAADACAAIHACRGADVILAARSAAARAA